MQQRTDDEFALTKATPRVVRTTVSMSRKVSLNYSTYEVSLSETLEIPDALTDRELAMQRHAVATRLGKQLAHELRAQFNIDPSA